MFINYNFSKKDFFNLKHILTRNKKRFYKIKKNNSIDLIPNLNQYIKYITDFFSLLNLILIDKYFCTNKNKLLSNSSYKMVIRIFKFGIEIPFNIFKFSCILPNIWSLEDRWSWLEKKKRNDWGDLEISMDNLKVLYRGVGKTDEDAAAIRSNNQIPRTLGVFYFEVKIINAGRSGFIGIGLCSKNIDLDRLPGWEMDSLGYHGDDGNIFKDSGIGMPYGPKFTTGDVIGLCWNLVKKVIFFTKNGFPLENAFLKYSPFNNHVMVPVVGLRTPGEQIEVNFCKYRFEFDINYYIRNESRILIKKAIKLGSPTNLMFFSNSKLFVKYQDIKTSKILFCVLIYYKIEKFMIIFNISNHLYYKTKSDLYYKLISIIYHEKRKILVFSEKSKTLNFFKIIKQNLIIDTYFFFILTKKIIFKTMQNKFSNIAFQKNLCFLPLPCVSGISFLLKVYYYSIKILLVHTFVFFISIFYGLLTTKKVNTWNKKVCDIVFILSKKKNPNYQKICANLIDQKIKTNKHTEQLAFRYYEINILFIECLIILTIGKFNNYNFNMIHLIDIQYSFILFKLWK
jgi:hypothetical protein